MKLKIAQKGTQYVNGKNDLFSVVIALRYMLSDSWYKEFIKELKVLIDKYLKKDYVPQIIENLINAVNAFKDAASK